MKNVVEEAVKDAKDKLQSTFNKQQSVANPAHRKAFHAPNLSGVSANLSAASGPVRNLIWPWCQASRTRRRPLLCSSPALAREKPAPMMGACSVHQKLQLRNSSKLYGGKNETSGSIFSHAAATLFQIFEPLYVQKPRGWASIRPCGISQRW